MKCDDVELIVKYFISVFCKKHSVPETHMFRVITVIVLATFFPMQLYAFDPGFGGNTLDTNTQIEYFVPRSPDKPQVQHELNLTEKILEEPPKVVEAENSGTNWWLWGGLAAVAGGIVALVAGGSKSGGSTGSSGGGTATTTVAGSW